MLEQEQRRHAVSIVYLDGLNQNPHGIFTKFSHPLPMSVHLMFVLNRFLGREEAEEEVAAGLSLRQPQESQLVGLQILLL
jgi:hypothetical protein